MLLSNVDPWDEDLLYFVLSVSVWRSLGQLFSLVASCTEVNGD